MRKKAGFVVSLSLALSVAVTGLGGEAVAKKKELPYVQEILTIQQGMTEKELVSTAKAYAKQYGLSVEDSLEQFYDELAADKQEGDELAGEVSVLGGSSGSRILPVSEKGNIYYTNSYTAFYNHGHVGMYSASNRIVEAVPDAGVRTIAYNARNVEPNSFVQRVNVSSTQKSNAANWALERVGESYSYNFVNNRNTSHYGDKNCSKLLWSAFMLKAGIDLDANGGAGVYPRDITASSYTTTVITIP